MPYYAKTLPNGGMQVGMRCDDCGHEWRFDMPVITPVLMPKADRREHD